MFRCIAYNETLKEEWDNLALSRGTIFHATAFRRILMETFDYQCAYHAVVDEDNHMAALLPLVTARNLGLKKVGVAVPFINYLDICAVDIEARQFALACLPEIRNRLQLSYIELRLKEQEIKAPDWVAHSRNYTFVLPLGGTEEQILSLSSASNRNHVRKVYRNQWFQASLAKKNLDAFYRVYVKRMKQLGSPAPSIRFFQLFFEYLPKSAYLLTVLDKQSGKIAGGMILIASSVNSTLYYPYGANLVEYNHKYLNNFMYWEAVKLGKHLGLQYLDLGRSQAGSGTYRYKEQWGAAARPLKYMLYAPGSAGISRVDKDRLGLFIALWKKMPQWLTEPAGKQLIRYVLP